MSTLNPEQLPSSNAQFIAYGQPERVADPFGGDDAISVRPQVFVRYYRGIKIKELREPNPDTLNVVFDPESVGLQKEFGAYMNADDPVVPYLREMHENQRPIDVGLEIQRRKRTKNTKANISPLTPIHALRGANDPSGSGDNAVMMGAAGNNINSKVGLVNGRRTTVIESDPREWQILTSNTQGDLPPEGWKALLDRDDWKRIGAITPKGDAIPAPTQQGAAQAPTPGAGPGIDMNALSKIIGHEVRKGLKEYGEYLMRQDEATNGTPTSQAPSSTVEGKPWTTWVNKEHLNLGSYLVTGEGHALRWAYRYFGNAADEEFINDEEIRWAAAQELADASQKIADRVQAAAYNGEVRADRTSASFKEAVMWVRFFIEETYPFETSPDFDFEQWFEKVGRAATRSLKMAENSAHSFLAERNPRAAQETNRTPQGQPNQANAQSTPEDRTPVIDAYLQMLTRAWHDRDSILQMAHEAKDKGLLDTNVWANPHDGQFSSAPFDGAREITIGFLTRNQYELLNQAAQVAPVSEPAHEEATPPPEDYQAPTQQPQPNAARTEQHIAADLSRATTEAEIAAIYNEARELNLLMVEIAVLRNHGPFGIAPVPPQTEGAESLPLGAVFDAISSGLDNQEQQQPSQAQSEAQDQPEQTQQQPNPQTQTTEEPQLPAHVPQPESAPTQAAAQPDQTPAPADTPAQEGTAPTDEAAIALQIAERALQATSADDINALYAEAQEAGIESVPVELKGGNGPLASFLKSRLKRFRNRG